LPNEDEIKVAVVVYVSERGCAVIAIAPNVGQSGIVLRKAAGPVPQVQRRIRPVAPLFLTCDQEVEISVVVHVPEGRRAAYDPRQTCILRRKSPRAVPQVQRCRVLILGSFPRNDQIKIPVIVDVPECGGAELYLRQPRLLGRNATRAIP